MSMEKESLPGDPRVAQFWSRYVEVLKRFRVPDRVAPWYRRHVQAFIDAHPRVRLQAHSAETLQAWLERLGRDTRLQDWQFRQRVDALRLLFCYLLARPWAMDLDWDRWMAGARTLGADHPSVVRTYEEIDRAVARADNPLGQRDPHLYRRFLTAIRLPDYAANTEKSYLGWINRFLRFHHDRRPCDCAEPEVASFLEDLALRRKVAGATQSQALNALVFFFARVLERPLGRIGPYQRPKRPRRLPTVLSPAEVEALFARLEGMNGLMIRLMYGSGMRLTECARLRLLDLDFDYHQILVRAAKGNKDRAVPMPERLSDELHAQIARVRHLHERDLKAGFGTVFLPTALARKYPNAARELRWQYLFPASRIGQDPRTGEAHRHHIHPSVIQKAVKRAATQAGLRKRVTSQTLACNCESQSAVGHADDGCFRPVRGK